MAWAIGNYALSQEQMNANALEVYKYLSAREWSLNAIAGLLGNMQSESYVNPGVWQSLQAIRVGLVLCSGLLPRIIRTGRARTDMILQIRTVSCIGLTPCRSRQDSGSQQALIICRGAHLKSQDPRRKTSPVHSSKILNAPE